jgi:hypothetical protein
MVQPINNNGSIYEVIQRNGGNIAEPGLVVADERAKGRGKGGRL